MSLYRYPIVEVCLDTLLSNLNVIRSMLSSRCKIMGVVKAGAYGHGALPVSRILLENGVYMLGVASFDEGCELRRGGICAPILVLSEVPSECISKAANKNLTLTVHSRSFLESISQKVPQGKQVSIHIKVDTGMGRLGFAVEDAADALDFALSHSGCKVEGIFTHFARAETPSEPFTKKQIYIFTELLLRIRKAGMDIPITHAANSAGIFNYPESHFDMVRPGISLYGIPPQEENNLGLAEIITWKTELLQIKWVPKGTSISYGSTFITTRRSLIGTIRIGYADGYNRLLSNQGHVIIKGRLYPIVGRICMDISLVDLTNAPNVSMSDEVTLIGCQGGEKITASHIASLCGTIPYEVLCNIGARASYIYKRNDKTIKTKRVLKQP